jgi:hypothetical protein
MELDDFAQPEVGVAVAITAMATSPSVRKTLRKGAAYGLAGVLLAGDAAQRFVNAVAKSTRNPLHSPQRSELVVATVETPGELANG